MDSLAWRLERYEEIYESGKRKGALEAKCLEVEGRCIEVAVEAEDDIGVDVALSEEKSGDLGGEE